jgi:hypothetical protein
MHYNNIFSKFYNKHLGQTAVLFGTGPTLTDFHFDDIADWTETIKVGVNSMAYVDKIALDYYFCGHDSSKEAWHYHNRLEKSLFEQIKNRTDIGQKFCATLVDNWPHPFHFSEAEAVNMNSLRYSITSLSGHQHIQKDIASHNLYNHSIIFSALQFILYSGVKKVYLVGCDCGGGFSFAFPNQSFSNSEAHSIYTNWIEFKKFLDNSYPDVEIVSIRPVGLKGLFPDTGEFK